MGRTTTTTSDDLETNPLLTTIGFLMEAHAGLVATFERHLEEQGAVCGQSFEILLRLFRSPEHRLRMSDLAAQTTLTASGLTRAIDRLERDGVVARQACPEDRRVSYAALTPAGEADIRAALPLHVEQIAELLDHTFSPKELAQLDDLLRRLRDRVNPAAACASLPGGTPDT
ncbi:MAG: MarR family winged helix-turn-helix transcriptional regulator [Microthrixaceae bacterium]